MDKNRCCVSMFVCLLLFSVRAVVLAQDAVKQEGESAKRSTIVEVDGYAFLSEDRTIKQMREEALTNAKREALERAQTYIQSVSKVENFQLSYDIVESQAEGAIRVLESRDYGITDDNRYRYWIKAEVTYSLKPSDGKADLSAELVKNPDAPLTVYVWTERTEYKSGQKIKVFLQGNKDFYARVVYRDVRGNLLQLLPNPHRKENFFKGGKVVVIPGQGDRFDLEVGPPFGIENIIVYASSAEMGETSLENRGDALYGVKDDLKDFAMKTRGVKIVRKKAGEKTSGAEFYETSCEVRTKME